MIKPPQFLKNSLTSLFGNHWGQRSLCEIIRGANYVRGIGSGGGVSSSGERAVVERLMLEKAPHEKICVFDVGANFGQFLELTLSVLKNRDLSIYSFEPVAQTFAQLQAKFNACNQVTLCPVGISDIPGEREIFITKSGAGLSSVYKRQTEHRGILFTEAQKEFFTTIDLFCEQHTIQRIDLLKLDIEGHELAALRGASKMFAQGNIGSVLFEFGGCNIDSRTFLRDFFYFFAAVGLPKILRVTPSGYLHPVEQYAENLECFDTTNFLAVAK